ncbi:MAG: hypothetical protein N3A68_02130 [Bacteroidia bacterium]|jgi:hypothetical protein|nr:hypothetical protein [Bacteroidia bacterium]GIV23267.1 MAG: hypothetical protein KatS3mg025_0926 [Bacteroidia bacterium]
MSTVGVALPLPTLYRRVQWAYPLLFEEIVFKSEPPLRTILQNHPKVVHAISHAGTLGWIPAILALLKIALMEGGKNRKALGVFHRGLYKVTLSRWILRSVFQSTEPPTFAKVITAFKEGPITDVALFPEGDNCVVGDVHEIRPFRSPKFIELALAAQAPILVTVHRGSEEWGKDFYIPSWMLRWVARWQPSYVRPLMKNPILNLPTRLTRIPKFSLHSALYFPRLAYEELSSRPRERWFQLQSEAQQVKRLMEALLQEMPYV